MGYNKDMKQGLSSIPFRTNIDGQDHSLAYITPDEANMLRSRGGGVTPDGGQYMHNGIPAFKYGGDTSEGGATGGPSGDRDSGGRDRADRGSVRGGVSNPGKRDGGMHDSMRDFDRDVMGGKSQRDIDRARAAAQAATIDNPYTGFDSTYSAPRRAFNRVAASLPGVDYNRQLGVSDFDLAQAFAEVAGGVLGGPLGGSLAEMGYDLFQDVTGFEGFGFDSFAGLPEGDGPGGYPGSGDNDYGDAGRYGGNRDGNDPVYDALVAKATGNTEQDPNAGGTGGTGPVGGLTDLVPGLQGVSGAQVSAVRAGGPQGGPYQYDVSNYQDALSKYDHMMGNGFGAAQRYAGPWPQYKLEPGFG